MHTKLACTEAGKIALLLEVVVLTLADSNWTQSSLCIAHFVPVHCCCGQPDCFVLSTLLFHSLKPIDTL